MLSHTEQGRKKSYSLSATVIIFSACKQRCCLQDQRAVTMETAPNTRRCVWVFQAFTCELSVHVQLSLSPSVCPIRLSGCVSVYLLLMFVCSMQPSNIFGRTELSPPIFEQLSSYYLWCEIILGYFKCPSQRLCLHDREKLLINAHQQDFIQKWPFLQMRACFLVFWFVWFWLLSFFTSSLQKYSFMLRLSVVIISIFCLRNHVFTSV